MTNGRKLKLLMCSAAVISCLLFQSTFAVTNSPPSLDWIQQLGTSRSDIYYDVSTDGLGNVYASGYSEGNLPGPNAGGYDVLVSKYNAAGSLLWNHQLGSAGDEQSFGVSSDHLGNVFVTGYTSGNLAGANAGSDDAFAARYDSAGNLIWSRQWGTSGAERSNGAAADGLGNVYIGGVVAAGGGIGDAFVLKYDSVGSLLWSRQFGTNNSDGVNGLATDGLGNVYFAGYSAGSLSGTNIGVGDAIVGKFDPSGNLLWTRQFGTTASDEAIRVATDNLGNVFVVGDTEGSLGGTNAGRTDAFISKFDSSGNLVWSRQLGMSSGDFSAGVSADNKGNVYLVGYTEDSLGGTSAGEFDMYVTKYDSNGNQIWIRQLGTSGDDEFRGVAADSLGSLYVAGFAGGSLAGPFKGGFNDTIIAKFSDVPEPQTIALLVIVPFCLTQLRKQSLRS